MPPQRTAIYCRISSDREGAGLGVKRQEQDCRELCERRGWAVAEVYVDNDLTAYSNRKPRPAYTRMLKDLEAGQRDALVTWHVDRLTRQPRELEDVIDLHDKAKFKMATVTGDIDLGTDDGRFHARILGAVARKESDDKKRRIRRKMEQNALAGKGKGGGTRPFGYEPDRLTICKSEAKLVREAAQRILSGESLRSVCSDFNQRGIKTVTGKTWRTGVLKRVLTSPRVAGLREHRGEVVTVDGKPVKAEWKGILDLQSWEALRFVLEDPGRRKNQKARKYLLTGYACCGLCGKKLIARPKADGRRCYVCASGPNFEGCGKIRQLAEPLEKLVVEEVAGNLHWLDELVNSPSKGEDTEAKQQELLDQLQLAQVKLDRVHHDYYVGEVLEQQAFLSVRRTLEEQVAEAKRQLAQLKPPRLRGGNPWQALLDMSDEELEVTVPDWETEPQQWDYWRRLVDAGIERVVLGPAVKGQNFFNPERVKIWWKSPRS